MQWRKAARILIPAIAAVLAATAGFIAQSLLPDKNFGRFAAGASALAAEGDLFTPIAKVLREPRCMNCHPVGDHPRQGDDRHVHLQNVTRGADDMGFVNLRCPACHRDENNDFSGVPGAPEWHLAPLAMGWEGLSDNQLCTLLKEKSRNGGRDVSGIVEHLTKAPLVLWGWKPGGKRQPVSTPLPEFIKQVHAWQKADAPCPAAAQ